VYEITPLEGGEVGGLARVEHLYQLNINMPIKITLLFPLHFLNHLFRSYGYEKES